ncbi:MAG TPA: type II CAAX endopeptidase family protein [Terracidiphilus sp.]|nr:type II CAAX endopeptidase family protein [Terracidiphilus sp.]
MSEQWISSNVTLVEPQEDLAAFGETSHPKIASGVTGNGKLVRWFELCLVLAVTFGGALFSSLDLLQNGPNALAHEQSFRWIYGLLREITCLALLGYVLWRRKLRFRDLGLRWSMRDVGMGLVVAIIAYITYAFGYTFVHFVHRAVLTHATGGVTAREMFTHLSVATIVAFLVNPFVEELIVRAYLMTEIGELTGSWTLAAAVSVAVQTSYHLYYGWVTALSLGFQFAIFAIYYARSRRATPIVVAHGIFDILGLIHVW